MENKKENKKLRPKVLISKCLEHGHCRYDGSMISSEFIKRIKDYVDFQVVCPEMDIGLPVPREAIRIVYKDGEKFLVESMSGKDHTEKMNKFADEYSHIISKDHFDGAILKSRSPSCGIKDVKMYPSAGRVNCSPIKSSGFFGGAIQESHPHLPLEDEGRLRNYDIRDHFLTRIYTIARFQTIKDGLSLGELVKFHSEHKYLLMAYHQTKLKELGSIVANHGKHNKSKVFMDYEENLKMALARPMKKGKNTNMILHMFGYVSDFLSADEKAYFLDQLGLYNQNKKPFSVIMAILYGWVIRFDVDYLNMQHIFEPYPIEILDVMDSGKGVE